MEISEVLSQFRLEIDDVAQPNLISDEEAMRHLAEAQDKMVRAMGGIADATTSDIVDVPLVAEEPFSDISPYILRIRSGRLLTARRDVTFAQEADAAKVTRQDYGVSQGITFDDDDVGNVTHGFLGVEDNKVRWYRVPADSDTCRLHVYRLPYPRLTDEDGEPLEVPEERHLDLILWMKHKAYAKQDSELYDPKRSSDNEGAFVRACDAARKDVERRRYRVRTVVYGGL